MTYNPPGPKPKPRAELHVRRMFTLPPEVSVILTRQAKREDRPASQVVAEAVRRWCEPA